MGQGQTDIFHGYQRHLVADSGDPLASDHFRDCGEADSCRCEIALVLQTCRGKIAERKTFIITSDFEISKSDQQVCT